MTVLNSGVCKSMLDFEILFSKLIQCPLSRNCPVIGEYVMGAKKLNSLFLLTLWLRACKSTGRCRIFHSCPLEMQFGYGATTNDSWGKS